MLKNWKETAKKLVASAAMAVAMQGCGVSIAGREVFAVKSYAPVYDIKRGQTPAPYAPVGYGAYPMYPAYNTGRSGFGFHR